MNNLSSALDRDRSMRARNFVSSARDWGNIVLSILGALSPVLLSCFIIFLLSNAVIISICFAADIFGGNSALILQRGDSNSVVGSQYGGGNSFDLAQTGDLNSVNFVQQGIGNNISINQLGDGNLAGSKEDELAQVGHGNSLEIEQFGNQNTIFAHQEGNYNWAIVYERGYGNDFSLMQMGNENNAKIQIIGNDNGLGLTQRGDNNSFTGTFVTDALHLSFEQVGGAVATINVN